MKGKPKIKVLIVDDSLLFRETLTLEMDKDRGIEVVGTASDPYEARDKIMSVEPDVMTLDVEMPKMDGISFLKKLMPQYPLPVVVVSSDEKKVLDALDAGAVDFVAKPNSLRSDKSSFLNELIIKIKIASSAKVGSFKKDYIVQPVANIDRDLSDMIIAIGASTGGTEAIYTMIKAFPRDMPGIVIVQHMPAVFTKLYAERLNNLCKLEIKEAKNGDLVKPGRVLIAPGEYHMRLFKGNAGYYVTCKIGEKVSGHCPSVDVLFDSVARAAKNKSVGVILTGMGSDGAKGLLTMKKQGAYTLGQDEESSVVYGMPLAAWRLGGVEKQLPLEKIAKDVCDHLSLEF